MLLKMRGVLPKTTVDAATGCLLSADRENEAAVEWFEVVKLSGECPFAVTLSSSVLDGFMTMLMMLFGGA